MQPGYMLSLVVERKLTPAVIVLGSLRRHHSSGKMSLRDSHSAAGLLQCGIRPGGTGTIGGPARGRGLVGRGVEVLKAIMPVLTRPEVISHAHHSDLRGQVTRPYQSAFSSLLRTTGVLETGVSESACCREPAEGDGAGTAQSSTAGSLLRKGHHIHRRTEVLTFAALMRAAYVLSVVAALGILTLPARAETPRPVRAQTVEMAPSEVSLTYSGTIQPRVLADLGFRVGGKVIGRPVNVGDFVKSGQVIAKLDPTDVNLNYEADEHAVAAARASAVNARAEFERYVKMGQNSAAFLPSEFDKRQAATLAAEARLAQAERQLALAREQLSYMTLHADTDGVITALYAQVGQVINAGQTVASLATLPTQRCWWMYPRTGSMTCDLQPIFPLLSGLTPARYCEDGCERSARSPIRPAAPSRFGSPF
jgi:biotin carboxyl carrier protein